jgi:hypothetical protein
LIFEFVLSLTEDAGASETVGEKLPSVFVAVVAAVVTVEDSLGAEVGGRDRRRSEPEMLKEEREERDEVEGLGWSGDGNSEGEAAPSVCACGDNGDLIPKPFALLLFRAPSRGLATTLRAGLPLWL